MKQTDRDRIINVLSRCQDITIATVRPDGAEPEPSSAAASGATHGMRRAPSSLAAALIDDDRHHGPATSRNRAW